MSFDTPRGLVRAVNGVSFELDRGATLAVVGESGSGKSVMLWAIMNRLPRRGVQREGQVIFNGQDLFALSTDDLRAVLGKDIALVPQHPTGSLNPVLTVGQQMRETIRVHLGLSRRRADEESLALLSSVGIPEPRRRLDDYPHQMSGGMGQRVMIAMALACRPKLVIADEPTTALDVTVQAQILDLMLELQMQQHMALIIVTHDMGVAAACADRIAVMYSGRFVEIASTADLFGDYRMPYTEALLKSIPDIDRKSRLIAISGEPPDPISLPLGCSFSPRCVYATARCDAEIPPLELTEASNHSYRCWNPILAHEDS